MGFFSKVHRKLEGKARGKAIGEYKELQERKKEIKQASEDAYWKEKKKVSVNQAREKARGRSSGGAMAMAEGFVKFMQPPKTMKGRNRSSSSSGLFAPSSGSLVGSPNMSFRENFSLKPPGAKKKVTRRKKRRKTNKGTTIIIKR